MLVVYLNLGDAAINPEIAVNIAIDDSGSMSGEPIGEVRSALRALFDEAPEGARLGLIAFGSEVRLIAEPTEHREFLHDQIVSFAGESGSTMLWDAIGEACNRFDDEQSQRFVLVLTDGGDTGSAMYSIEPGSQRTSLIDWAVAQGVRVYCIGFGNVDRQPLERLAAATGGRYLDAVHARAIPATLRDAMRQIVEDRGEVKLRPEFTRLVQRSAPDGHPWLVHLSIDPWSGAEIWSDSTHILFPAEGVQSTAEYRKHWPSIQVVVRDRLEEILRGQARQEALPPDVDVLLVGWVADPCFRALATGVMDVVGDIGQRLGGLLPGVVLPVIVPLVHEAGNMSTVDMTESYAWLTAVRNHGGVAAPKAVVSYGDNNQHRGLNPFGYSSMSRTRVIQCAANGLRALALNPQHITATVGYGGGGSLAMHSSSAVTLDAGGGAVFEGQLLEEVERVVEAVCTRPASPTAAADRAQRMFRDSGLELEAVKRGLLAPLEAGSPEGVLAAVRLDHSAFWPPFGAGDPADYLASLPLYLDERGAEYLYRKLEALRRVVGARSDSLFGAVMRDIATDVDEILFHDQSGSVPEALAYLSSLTSMVDEQNHRIREDTLGAEFEATRLFASDERAVESSGGLDRAAARRALEDRIANRPLAEAVGVRHAAIAVAAGVATHGLVGLVPFAAFALGPFGVPAVAGMVATSLAVGVGVARWVLAQQRLETAVREYTNTMVRDARRAATRECLDQLRVFYDRVAAWVGDRDEVPPLDEGESRDEEMLSERQRVSVLRDQLTQLTAALRKRHSENLFPQNPYVWELGSEIENPSGRPRLLPFRKDGHPPQFGLAWGELMPAAENRRWRELCRRRRCTDLQSYLDYHEERLALGRRMTANAAAAAARIRKERQRISDTLLPEAMPGLHEVFGALEIVAFPPLSLGDTAVPRLVRTWLADTAEIQRLAARPGFGSGAAAVGIPAHASIEAVWELHRSQTLTSSLEDARAFNLFRMAWDELDADAQLKSLALWGGSADWHDPATGAPEPTTADSGPANDEILSEDTL